VHTVLLIQLYKVIKSVYKETWEASYEEKRKIFDPFAVSAMKDKELVHILTAPSSLGKLSKAVL